MKGGGASYQYYCKIDAVTTSPTSHGSLPRRIAWFTAVVSITAWFITAVYNILYSTAAVSIHACFITVVYTKIFSTAVINITALFITAVYITTSSTAAKKKKHCMDHYCNTSYCRIVWSTTAVPITAWFITAVFNISYSTAVVYTTA